MRTKLKLKAGRSKRLNIKLANLPALPDGDYHLVAQLTRPDGGSELRPDPRALAMAAPRVDLRATAVSLAPIPPAPGQLATADVTIENLGNVPARGTFTVTLRPANNPTGPAIAVVPARLNLAVGNSATVRLRFTLPGALSPGDLNLAAEVSTETPLAAAASHSPV